MSTLPRPPPFQSSDCALRTLTWVVLATVLVYVVWEIADVLLLIFAGLLMAVFLRGLGDGLAKFTGLSEGRSLVVAILLLLTLLGLAGWFLGAEVLDQLDQLIPRVRLAWLDVRDYLDEFDWGRVLLVSLSFKSLAKDKEWLAWMTGGVFAGTVGLLAGFILVFFIGLYAAASPRTYVDGFLHLIPARRRQRAAEVLSALGLTLHWWLIGAFAKMTMVGVCVTFGLWALDMPLSLALGTLAFFFVFVPYVGPLLASIPALLVAMAVGSMEVLYVALLYLGVHAAEGYVLSPLIDQRSVKLPPVVALAAQVLFGTSSLGLLGVFFATPVAAAAMVLVKMLYIEDRLGECTDAVDGQEGAACVPARMPGAAGQNRTPTE